ncbi:hypothetical protein DUT90_11185 [Polaribacter sp. WD7]|uniref:DUF6498-containing protein n=1 Tax=Polaribacter sp. WD7 TaxID=2269061 RepID=UPI000DF274A8|nr:DUF6498-containing protein [Polaribacter sp. WD7]RCS26327.1 hypothetical protein DUT90_11185 [Polaribacter sp. WD7]
MFKNIFYPTTQNVFIWLGAIYLLFLLYIGKASPIIILFAYFLETIIIGLFTTLKMLWSIVFGKSKGFSLLLIFTIHYGFFVAIQSIFGFALFSIENTSVIKEPFHILQNYGIIINLEGIQYAFPAIFLNHIGKFISDFLHHKKYLVFSAKDLMFKPYVRIFIQQFVVIISFFFIVFTNIGFVSAILLVLFRLIVDLSLESIKKNSKTLDALAQILANKKVSIEEIKKQLILFTE